nr:MAG TPA: hypothetical protein [Caudoviricetes sp.]
MTMDYDLIKSIANDHKRYLENETKSLQERIEEVKLSEEQEEKVKLDTVVEVGVGAIKKGTSVLTGGTSDIIFEISGWKKKLDENMDDAKKMILLNAYFSNYDNLELAVENLCRVLSDLYGQTLFSKIDSILVDNVSDMELLKRLSNVMKKISDEKNIENIFTKAKQLLNILGNLSPATIYMICDFKNWPQFSMETIMAPGGKVIAFEAYFVNGCLSQYPNLEKVVIETAVTEMVSTGLIYGLQIDDGYEVKAELTDTGKFLIDFIS